MKSLCYSVLALVMMGVVAVSGCSDDPAALASGSIRVTASMQGSGADPDGFLVTVDSGAAIALAPNGSVDVPDLAAGAHTVTLSGVDPACTVEGDLTRSVTVSSDAQASVTFAVTCVASAAA